MLPVFTADEMRALDQRAIRDLGIPGATLMENAGSGAARAIRRWATRSGLQLRGRRVVIVCGKGGNGGDGFVVARWLRRWGVRPEVVLLAPPGELTGDAALKFRQLPRRGAPVHVIEDDAPAGALLSTAVLVVDAMLGTGARGAPSGLTARVIERLEASGRPVVALDVPSGLPADGGPPVGPCVRAGLTLTFGGLKQGLVTGRGLDYVGEVEVVPIGIAPAEVARGIRTWLLEAADVARHLPPRPRDVHKGTYGHVLVIAGSLGKTGAAALAAQAAMRAGVGLVTVATPASQQPIVAGLVLEAMTATLPETEARTVSFKAHEVLTELAGARDAVALGPGLGVDDEVQRLVIGLARDLPKPMVLDADALTALAGHVAVLREAPAARCLTPHPGEMARLLGVGTAEIQRDRVAATRRLATTAGAHVVLKGAGSVIAAPSGEAWVSPTGNAGMASGGTGDVLTGMVGALLARGLEPAAALWTAAWLHGRAGDRAAAEVGEEALVASDLIAALPDAFGELASAQVWRARS